MFKRIIIYIFLIGLFVSNYAIANENLLTLKQQLDRLQRDVNDLSKSVYNKSFEPSNSSNQTEETINFSAIDIRIYDLETDIKNLTLSFEELTFQLDDVLNSLSSLEQNINFQIENINNKLMDKQPSVNNLKIIEEESENEDKNTLGKLVISSDEKNNNQDELNKFDENAETQDNKEPVNLSPEKEFQLALDQMRLKNYDQSKVMLKSFINTYEENQLSGSAHFWLGKIYIFESNFREAVFVLGEGVQKFPKSIKAPNMLFELSNSLFEMKKKEEACKTLSIINSNYSESKIANLAIKKKTEMGCENAVQ